MCLGESSTRMGDLLGSPRVASLFLWYFSIVSGNSMFFLLITCYMPWTFRREHCPPWRNKTTGTPGAQIGRASCRGRVEKSVVERKITWTISDWIIAALTHRILFELRSSAYLVDSCLRLSGLLLRSRVASLFLWYFSIVSGNSMFFLLITCYMPWTFRREHCPPWRNKTTGTPGAHREACGHGRGAVKTLL